MFEIFGLKGDARDGGSNSRPDPSFPCVGQEACRSTVANDAVFELKEAA